MGPWYDIVYSRAKRLISTLMMPPAKYALLFAMLFFSNTIPGLPADTVMTNIESKDEHHLKAEKLTHLHFYLHSISGGPNPNNVIVAQAPTTANPVANPSFGTIAVVDDTLTEGPERSSKQIGNSQGIVALSSQTDPLLIQMAVYYVFTEGRYNGSSISVLARNQICANMRELPILGGTGVFRFAKGYALTSTYSNDAKNGVAVFEYDMYVIHH